MPFKSEAQRRKFAEMVEEGKISQAEFDRWQAETGNVKLPERLGGSWGGSARRRAAALRGRRRS